MVDTAAKFNIGTVYLSTVPTAQPGRFNKKLMTET